MKLVTDSTAEWKNHNIIQRRNWEIYWFIARPPIPLNRNHVDHQNHDHNHLPPLHHQQSCKGSRGSGPSDWPCDSEVVLDKIKMTMAITIMMMMPTRLLMVSVVVGAIVLMISMMTTTMTMIGKQVLIAGFLFPWQGGSPSHNSDCSNSQGGHWLLW